jgi:micrococcal nuclease
MAGSSQTSGGFSSGGAGVPGRAHFVPIGDPRGRSRRARESEEADRTTRLIELLEHTREQRPMGSCPPFDPLPLIVYRNESLARTTADLRNTNVPVNDHRSRISHGAEHRAKRVGRSRCSADAPIIYCSGKWRGERRCLSVEAVARPVAIISALAVVLTAVGIGATGAFAHQSGCHSAHSCPSDHHTYLWYDGGGQGWSCARPGSDTYDPARDTTTITYDGYTYYCYAYGSAPPPPPPDGDGDGVPDAQDACPTQTAYTTNGCPVPPPPPPEPPSRMNFYAVVTGVIDGDTIKVRRGFYTRYTVRLIGIDTPETKKPGTPVECGGREATSSMFRLGFTRPRDTDGDGLRDRKGGKGRRVKVTTDPTQDRRDQFGRLLAYVKSWRGSFAGAQLRAGWATVYVFADPFEQLGRFQGVEASARDAGRGVWGRCGGNFHTPARVTQSPAALAAEVHDCHHWAYYPNVLISSARNLRCRDAAREMRRYDGPIRRRFHTPRGFYCQRVSGGSLGGQWRCVRGRRAFRFEFGD